MSKRPKIDLPSDPTGIQEPHDVLAAEEFAIPARSAGDIPPDPAGIQEPHDVLAAEEFPIPAEGPIPESSSGLDIRSFIPGLALAGAVLLLARLLRRRR